MWEMYDGSGVGAPYDVEEIVIGGSEDGSSSESNESE